MERIGADLQIPGCGAPPADGGLIIDGPRIVCGVSRGSRGQFQPAARRCACSITAVATETRTALG